MEHSMDVWFVESSIFMLSDRITYCIACAPTIRIPCENCPTNTVLAPNGGDKPTLASNTSQMLHEMRQCVRPSNQNWIGIFTEALFWNNWSRNPLDAARLLYPLAKCAGPEDNRENLRWNIRDRVLNLSVLCSTDRIVVASLKGIHVWSLSRKEELSRVSKIARQ